MLKNILFFYLLRYPNFYEIVERGFSDLRLESGDLWLKLICQSQGIFKFCGQFSKTLANHILYPLDCPYKFII